MHISTPNNTFIDVKQIKSLKNNYLCKFIINFCMQNNSKNRTKTSIKNKVINHIFILKKEHSVLYHQTLIVLVANP
jgi:hypothetical protein